MIYIYFMKITGKIGPIQNVKTLVALGIIHTHTHIIYPFLFIYYICIIHIIYIFIFVCIYQTSQEVVNEM